MPKVVIPLVLHAKEAGHLTFKRDHAGDADGLGYRRQGRPRNQNRPAAAGAINVVVYNVGDLNPSLQYYIGNTPGKATDEIIKKVLQILLSLLSRMMVLWS